MENAHFSEKNVALFLALAVFFSETIQAGRRLKKIERF
jgi:hypothetical protein